MSSHSHDEGSKGYSPHIRGVALGILVMGISLAIIIMLWISFGYLGPSFSTEVMEQQQERLHEQYGLPPVQQLSPQMLQVPPSLRNVTSTTGGTNATNATTTTGSNATTNATTGGGGAAVSNATTVAGGTNATTTSTNATNATTTTGSNATTNATTGASNNTNTTTGTTNATTGGGGGGAATGAATSVSIVSGASSLTDTAFQPNPVQVSVGATVTWTNDDSQPHTVTSGQNAQPDGKFDSSPNFNPLIAPGQTFSHTFTEAGQYPYYCALHPNMVGTVSVS
jgi:plastocyanin